MNTATSVRLRFRILAALVGPTLLLLAQADRAEAADPVWKTKVASAPDTSHFVIRYNSPQASRLYRDWIVARRGEAGAGAGLTDAEKQAIRDEFATDTRLIFHALDKAYDTYKAQGFNDPALRTATIDGKSYLEVWLLDFRQPGVGQKRAGVFRGDWAAAGVPGPRGQLQISLDGLVKLKRAGVDPLRMANTSAHELFHAVQWAHSPQARSWLKESTAVWAADQVYPGINPHLADMRAYLTAMHYPITYDTRLADQNYDMTHGRPYGTVVFFRFLTAQDVGKDWAEVRQAISTATLPDNSLYAVSHALGDAAALGPSFHDHFDRFAVGALLLEEAPADCRLPEPGLFHDSGGKAYRPQSSDLSQFVERYFARYVKSPTTETVTMNLAFGGPVGWDDASRTKTVRAEYGNLAGCGARYFKLKKPPGTPDDELLIAVVHAPLAVPDPISVQGLAKRGSTWEIIKGRYDPSVGGYSVRIPDLGKISSNFVHLVIARYSADEAFTTFPMALTLKPPSPIKLKVTSINWKDAATVDGKKQTLIYGAVANQGDTAADNPILRLKGSNFNNSGYPLTAALLGTGLIGPDQAGAFLLAIGAENRQAQYDFDFDPLNLRASDKAITQGTMKLENVQILMTWEVGYDLPLPVAVVTAQVRNVSDKPIAETTHLIVTFFNEAGKVVGAGDGFTYGDLPAGGLSSQLTTRAFLCEPSFASYQLVATAADGTHYVSEKHSPGLFVLALGDIKQHTEVANADTPQETKVPWIGGQIKNVGQAPMRYPRPVYVFKPVAGDKYPRAREYPYMVDDEQKKLFGPGEAYTFDHPFGAEDALITILPAALLGTDADAKAGPSSQPSEPSTQSPTPEQN